MVFLSPSSAGAHLKFSLNMIPNGKVNRETQVDFAGADLAGYCPSTQLSKVLLNFEFDGLAPLLAKKIPDLRHQVAISVAKMTGSEFNLPSPLFEKAAAFLFEKFTVRLSQKLNVF